MAAVFGATELRRAALASLDALRDRREEIDRANVYPIPDGDTGTNLVLTMESVARALEDVPDDPTSVGHAIVAGSLMGARGNSGVILAQILRGICEAVDGRAASAEDLARGLGRAVELAYEAVLHPVEGTMLSVARAAAQAAATRDGDLAGLLDAAAAAAREALARTPEQLPILKDAGVVDAGGIGLVAVLEAFADAAAGRVPRRAAAPIPAEAPAARAWARRRETGSTDFAYEVQYMLEAPEDRIAILKGALGAIGDSVAVIGGATLWRVHVHTNDIGRAIELGIDAGRPSDVSVMAFEDQMAPPQRAPEPAGGGIPLARAGSTAALVAVADGAGMHRLLAELGATVVEGGPTMNPSVGEILGAIEAVPAENVIVLPNSDNVVPAALQAAARSSKHTQVLPTSDMAQGLAACVAYGDARGFEDDLTDMAAAMARVRTGRVAVATRDSRTPAGAVRAGQAIGFAGTQAVAVADDPVDAALRVAEALVAPESEVLTVLAGAEADPGERERLRTGLAQRFPGLVVEAHDGGQAAHRYLVAVE